MMQYSLLFGIGNLSDKDNGYHSRMLCIIITDRLE